MSNKMVLGAELPFFLPDLNFFLRMAASDQFVVADRLKFSSHSRVQRSKIILQNEDKWLTVPVFKNQNASILDIVIDHHQNWAQKICRRIRFAYHDAPYFDEFYPGLTQILNTKSKALLELNMQLILWLKDIWKIQTAIVSMSFVFNSLPAAGIELALCKKRSAHIYVIDAINKPLIKSTFPINGRVQPVFIDYKTCMPLELQAGLSISAIDFLFKYGPQGAIIFHEVNQQMKVLAK